MTVTPIPREPFRFMVQGRTLSCNAPGCHYTFSPHKAKKLQRAVGEDCPKCAKTTTRRGKLEHRTYLVDLTAFDGSGGCGCEAHQFFHAPKLKAMSADDRRQAWTDGTTPECEHVKVALARFARGKILEAMENERGGE